MRSWVVSMPIYGSADFFVKADTEAEAIARAYAGDWTEPPEVIQYEISERCENICHRTEHDRIDVTLNE